MRLQELSLYVESELERPLEALIFQPQFHENDHQSPTSLVFLRHKRATASNLPLANFMQSPNEDEQAAFQYLLCNLSVHAVRDANFEHMHCVALALGTYSNLHMHLHIVSLNAICNEACHVKDACKSDADCFREQMISP